MHNKLVNFIVIINFYTKNVFHCLLTRWGSILYHIYYSQHILQFIYKLYFGKIILHRFYVTIKLWCYWVYNQTHLTISDKWWHSSIQNGSENHCSK